MFPICNITLTVKKTSPNSYPSYKDTTLGAYLKRKRLGLKMTRVGCSRLFDVSLDTYRNWEWNWFTPNLFQKKKVNDFLGFNFWDDKSQSLSNRCLMYRIDYGLTQIQLAELMGINSKTVIRLESKHPKISNEIVRKFKDFFVLNNKLECK